MRPIVSALLLAAAAIACSTAASAQTAADIVLQLQATQCLMIATSDVKALDETEF